MLRKWMILAGTMAAVVLTATGLSMAALDDESEMEKLMEKVGAKSNAIKKAIRTPVAYKKDQKNLPGYADELIVLSKKARENKESSEKQKKPYDDWTRLCDDWTKKTEEFKAVVGKPATTQAEAKKAWNSVNTSCSACHTVFRVEDEQ